MTTLSIPNELANGDQEENLGDGDDVQENFEAIKTFYDGEVLNRDGSVSATGTIEVGTPTLGAHAATDDYLDAALAARLPTFIAVDERARTLPGVDQRYTVEFTNVVRNDGFTATDTAVTVGATGVYAIIAEGEFTPPSSDYALTLNFNDLHESRILTGGGTGLISPVGLIGNGLCVGGGVFYLAASTRVGLDLWAGILGEQEVQDTKLIVIRLKNI